MTDGLTPPLALPEDEALVLLTLGELEVEGQVLDSSNTTFYCSATLDGVAAACVYKPMAGERPLWDFPDGTLAEREVAAYAVSAATGWALVPPTVLRDGPAGEGMVQLWIDTDETVDLGRLVRRRNDATLRRIAVLDAVINNGDRKGGHLLPTVEGRIYGIDHGVTFNVDDKLRTVLWQWAGEPLTAEAVDTLIALRADIDGPLGERLMELLTTREVRRTRRRIDRLLRSAIHPEPSGDWPAVPWPPF
ncbi:MAG: hypothetical protein JWN20_2045 [Jatrophihabitantaceae bacterium]|nr:hypothetical protein [Jatrophihabitantaceae bacterium]